jgi:NAD dependent epimerase/dehydratase family enzyme
MFLTGATGFIGFFLVPELIKEDHHMVGLSRSESKHCCRQTGVRRDYDPHSYSFMLLARENLLEDLSQHTNQSRVAESIMIFGPGKAKGEPRLMVI